MKTVTIYLDDTSITDAMKTLDNYVNGSGEGTLTGIIDKKMQKVIDAAVAAARKHYRSRSTVVNGYKVNDNLYVIEAVGRQVTFLEFGAGLYANHGYAAEAEDLGFTVYSGSWSEWHKRTWQNWIASGGKPSKYPLNFKPRRGMYWAVRAARSALRRMTK